MRHASTMAQTRTPRPTSHLCLFGGVGSHGREGVISLDELAVHPYHDDNGDYDEKQVGPKPPLHHRRVGMRPRLVLWLPKTEHTLIYNTYNKGN